MSVQRALNPSPAGQAVGGASDPAGAARGPLLLICPRCALSILVRASWLLVEHCPRCVARAHMPVRLFLSPLQAEELYANGSAPDADGAAPTTRTITITRPAG